MSSDRYIRHLADVHGLTICGAFWQAWQLDALQRATVERLGMPVIAPFRAPRRRAFAALSSGPTIWQCATCHGTEHDVEEKPGLHSFGLMKEDDPHINTIVSTFGEEQAAMMNVGTAASRVSSAMTNLGSAAKQVADVRFTWPAVDPDLERD